jgi:hypothetical protein
MPPGGSRTKGLLANGPLLQAHDCDEQCYLHHSLNVPNICALVFGRIHQMALAGNWTLVPLLLDAIGLSQSAGYEASDFSSPKTPIGRVDRRAIVPIVANCSHELPDITKTYMATRFPREFIISMRNGDQIVVRFSRLGRKPIEGP